MAKEDVLVSMMADGPYYPCVAQFHNDLPANWPVRIIAIGAVFFYDDGTHDQVGPKAVNIPPGGHMEALEAPNIKKCVQQVTGAMSVKQEGYDPVSLSRANTCPPDRCMTLTHFVLYPKKDVAKSVFEQATIRDLIEISADR